MVDMNQRIRSLLTIKDDAHIKKIERLLLIMLIVGLSLVFLFMILDSVLYPGDPEISVFVKFAVVCSILLVIMPIFVVAGMEEIYRRKKIKGKL